jgi:hypothetical protein
LPCASREWLSIGSNFNSFRLGRDAFITNDTQFEHSLMARATITLF